jgi:hypothetical protein
MGMANTPSNKTHGLKVLKLGINCPFCFVTEQFTFIFLTCHELIKGFAEEGNTAAHKARMASLSPCKEAWETCVGSSFSRALCCTRRNSR